MELTRKAFLASIVGAPLAASTASDSSYFGMSPSYRLQADQVLCWLHSPEGKHLCMTNFAEWRRVWEYREALLSLADRHPPL